MTTLGELAGLVGGRLHGDPALPILGAAALADARAGEITLLDSQQRLPGLEASGAAAVVTSPDVTVTRPAIFVANPRAAFGRIVEHFRPARVSSFRGIHPSAVVSPTARVDDEATIHAGAIVEDDAHVGPGAVVHSGVRVGASAVIGRDSVLFPNVVLYENTQIGERVTIHANAVIGAHGFGYEQQDGRHVPSSQLGWVRICDDVEIGACATIDRGTYGPTVIGEGSKIDNLVQIAHNCRIGRHNLICAQAGIAGSTTTGDYVVMAGQVGVRDHVHIGDGAILSAKAGITADVPPRTVMMGIPATPEREQKLKQAALAKLAEMRKEFKAVKRSLADLAQVRANNPSTPLETPHVEHEAA